MNELPKIELPPGYEWAWFHSDSINPGIRSKDKENFCVYYRESIQSIRAKFTKDRYSTAYETLNVDEAIPIMAQMVWLGEVT